MNRQMGGHGRLPGGGDIWVGGGDKMARGARHSSEKEKELPPKDWQEMSPYLPFGVARRREKCLQGTEEEQESLRGSQHTRGSRDTQLCLTESPQSCAGTAPRAGQSQKASHNWHMRSEMGHLWEGYLGHPGIPLGAKRGRGTWGLLMEEKLGSKTVKRMLRTGILPDCPGGVHPMVVAR